MELKYFRPKVGWGSSEPPLNPPLNIKAIEYMEAIENIKVTEDIKAIEDIKATKI